MNDFDRFLEQELRQMLDPVIATEPPARGERVRTRPEPSLRIEPAVEPAWANIVPLPVAAAPQL